MDQQHPKFQLKMITNKNTILIPTTKQKKEKEKKRGERKRVRTIMPGQVLCASKLGLAKMVLQEAGGASAAPLSLSRLATSIWTPSKLVRAYRVPLHVSQSDVSKRPLVKCSKQSQCPLKLIKYHRKIEIIIKESGPLNFPRHVLQVFTIRVQGGIIPSDVTQGLMEYMQVRGRSEK